MGEGGRRLPSDELVDCAADGPDVSGGCESTHLDDLGRHPVWRAHDRLLVGAALHERRGHAKVGELHLPSKGASASSARVRVHA